MIGIIGAVRVTPGTACWSPTAAGMECLGSAQRGLPGFRQKSLLCLVCFFSRVSFPGNGCICMQIARAWIASGIVCA